MDNMNHFKEFSSRKLAFSGPLLKRWEKSPVNS
jgi:hypothetical protein